MNIMRQVAIGLIENIANPDLSSPDIDEMKTTIEKANPNTAPTSGPNRTAPTIIGTNDNEIVAGRSCPVTVAKTCKTTISAIRTEVPTRR